MNKVIRFFPNRTEFKDPVGAIKVNEPVRFNLMFSRPSNPSEVFLVLTKDGESEVFYPMNFVTVNHNDLAEYTVSLEVKSKGLYFYHFQINTEKEDYRVGADRDLNALLGKGQEWQLTVFEETYVKPDWLMGGVMYQIFPDRFNIGGERLKTKPYAKYRDDWDGGIPDFKPDKEGKIRNIDFFGGNLQGIIKKLGYLKGLGVTCIYMNPIFEAHSNHKYDTGNYRKVDPDFGSIDDLKTLIKRADKKGIKIILDGVFSHTGDDSIYFNRKGTYDSIGAYNSVHSAYFEWYNFKNFPDEYDCWWNFDIQPNVNENNKHFLEFMCGIDGVIDTWTSMGIGGWRLDVADELPDKFLDRAVHAAKRANPEAIVLGEVWEDASNKIAYGKRRRYLNGGQLDSVMNYPFKEDILNFVRAGDSERLNDTVNVLINNYPKNVLNNLMNVLGTHDTARLLTVLGDCDNNLTRAQKATALNVDKDSAVKKLKMATVLQFMLPGVPCIYYGDEIGMEGFEDPFNRKPMAWNNKNGDVLRWYKKLGAIRASEKNILAEGDYRRLVASDGVYVFTRYNEIEKLIVIVNNGGKPYKFDCENEDYTDLISGKKFSGNVPDKSSVIIKLTKDIFIPEKK